MKTETPKSTLKVERAENATLSQFELAQKSIIDVGFKIKRHNKLKQDLTHLLAFEPVDKPSHYQKIEITDDSNKDFRISEPVVIREVVEFLVSRCRTQIQNLESEIIEDSKTITAAKAA